MIVPDSFRFLDCLDRTHDLVITGTSAKISRKGIVDNIIGYFFITLTESK